MGTAGRAEQGGQSGGPDPKSGERWGCRLGGKERKNEELIENLQGRSAWPRFFPSSNTTSSSPTIGFMADSCWLLAAGCCFLLGFLRAFFGSLLKERDEKQTTNNKPGRRIIFRPCL